MARYHVHRFEIFRMKIRDVIAGTPEQAVRESEKNDPRTVERHDFNWKGDGEYVIEHLVWAEEFEAAYYLVDPVNDNDEIIYEDSVWLPGLINPEDGACPQNKLDPEDYII